MAYAKAAGVFDLKGVRHAVTANAFPFVPSRLWLFLVLSSPRPGRYPSYVRVVNDKSDKANFFGELQPTPTFNVGDEILPGFCPIRCVFPEEGRYTVQLWFFQKQRSDVLKGELPFSVVKEGT
jgi:hypothetical protein